MDNIKEITKKIEGKAWEDAKAKALEKVSKKIKIDGLDKVMHQKILL